MSRKLKFIVTESSSGMAWDWGWDLGEGLQKLTIESHEETFLGDRNILKLDEIMVV